MRIVSGIEINAKEMSVEEKILELKIKDFEFVCNFSYRSP